jgi:hypothetical protein
VTLLAQVLQRPELRERPPVLVDIGASGRLHDAWRALAPHSICIAFDADTRDFDAHQNRAHPFRQLHLHNNIVSAESAPELDFYLTRSPHCSSSLEPNNEKIAAWVFADLFDVQERVRLKARTLSSILDEHGLGYVDWFKTDSQGTDLRLFMNLGDAVIRRVLTASFEPGILDAYRGEDKLHALMAKMETLPFWMDELDVRGTQRLSRQLWEVRVRERTRGYPPLGLRDAPGWAEVSYLNTLEPAEHFDLRDHLLAWVIASIRGQHGYALDVALRGEQRFGTDPFSKLADESLTRTVRPADRLLPQVAKKAITAARSLGMSLLKRS